MLVCVFCLQSTEVGQEVVVIEPAVKTAHGFERAAVPVAELARDSCYREWKRLAEKASRGA